MKKTLAAALIGIIAAQTAAFAAQTELTDASSGKIRITGSASAGQNITLLILNPGCTADDALSDTSNSVQYLGNTVADKDGYSFDVEMNTADGGIFTVYITADGTQSAPDEFEFYPSAVKKDIIDKINSSSSVGTSLLDEAIQAFSLSKSSLYIQGNKKEIAAVLEKMKDACDGKKFPDDISDFYTQLCRCLILSGYNTGLTDCLIKDGFISNANMLGIADTPEYADYLNSLSVSGRSALNADLLSGTYYTVDSFTAEFNKLIAHYVITGYSKLGSGHIAAYFEKYRSIYEAAGFDFSHAADNSIYAKLLSGSAKNIGELARLYNSLTAPSTGGGGGGGGGGSSSSGSGTSKVTVQPIPDTGSNYYEASEKSVFSDVAADFWAYEYILPLYNAGIINGYDGNIFSPYAEITRAEFTKLVCAALKLETAQHPSPFTDTLGAWCEEYVNTAYENGIINGISDNIFGTDIPVTREQAAAIIYRAAKDSLKSENEIIPFADDADISDYAKSAVYGLRSHGIISGRSENRFEPSATLTRAEAAKMIFGITDMGGDIQ